MTEIYIIVRDDDPSYYNFGSIKIKKPVLVREKSKPISITKNSKATTGGTCE